MKRNRIETKPTMVLFIDAFRYDYLSAEETPFLYGIAEQQFSASVQTILGYSDAIDASIFTGVQPRQHGHWIMHKYQPQSSPLKMFKVFSFIDMIPSDFVIRGTKFVLSAFIGKLLARKYKYEQLSTHNIPYKVIDQFGWTTRKGVFSKNPFPEFPTLFDILEQNGMSHVFIDAAKLSLIHRYNSSKKIRGKVVDSLTGLAAKKDLYFIYFHHLDHFAHRYRTDSKIFRDELKEMDRTIEYTINSAKSLFHDELNIMIISDHGMVNTDVFIDVRDLVQDRAFGKDYLLFLDSTMIHIWYLNESKRNEVRRRIENLNCGRFIDRAEKKCLGLDFDNRDYGDEIYLLEPGYSIFPNFMSWLKPHAMHAYDPKEQSQLGIMLAEGTGLAFEDRRSAHVLDISPSILDMVGIDIPDYFRGKSIIRH